MEQQYHYLPLTHKGGDLEGKMPPIQNESVGPLGVGTLLVLF
jgi:hypothetical protein